MTDLQGIDYAVLVFYLVLVVGIGFYFRRFVRGGRDYFVAGNIMPWWVAGLSIFMGQFSAWTFTGAAGMAYKHGTTIMVCFMMALAGYLFAAFVVAPRWRRSRVVTPVQFLRQRYNPSTIKVYSWFLSVLMFLTVGITLNALAKFFGGYVHLSQNMVLNIDYIILVGGAIVLFYTLLGGLWAVAISDVVQFIILLTIVVFMVPLTLGKVGGLQGLIAQWPAGELSPLDPKGLFQPANFKSLVYLFGWMIMLATAANSEKAAQRYFSVPDERHSRNAAIMAGLCFFLCPILFFIPPLVARVVHPGLTDAQVDQAYALIAKDVLPAGMIGLLLAGMASATMSAIDSIVNMVPAILSRDVFQPMLKLEGDDRALLVIGKIITLVLGLGAIGIAILVNHGFASVFGALTKLWAWGGLSYALPVILGLLVYRTSKWAALIVLPVGTATAVICTQVLKFQPYGYTIPIVLAVTLATFLGSGLFDRRGKDPEYDASRDELFGRLSRPVDVAEEVERARPAATGPSPMGFIGVCTVLIAAMLGVAAALESAAGDRMVVLLAAAVLALVGIVLLARARRRARGAVETTGTES